jgi:hypothetical protein
VSALLTPDEVAALPEGHPIIVTWSSNGPHRYVVTIDKWGVRYATQPGHVGGPMQFYNRLGFVGSDRCHTRVIDEVDLVAEVMHDALSERGHGGVGMCDADLPLDFVCDEVAALVVKALRESVS